MEIAELEKTIERFWESENRNDVYFLGLCSEFAVALKKFLGGGVIYKAGLMHTLLYYKGHYCDIRGCFDKKTYAVRVPATSLTPATKKEIAHIYKLLDYNKTNQIVKGLKKAQKNNPRVWN